jgi:DNA polymerase elongation subunit (family B)
MISNLLKCSQMNNSKETKQEEGMSEIISTVIKCDDGKYRIFTKKYVIFTKKSSIVKDDIKDKDKLQIKGITLKRRDNFKLRNQIMDKLLKELSARGEVPD